MEKLERMYNKVNKALNIPTYKEIKKEIKELYSETEVPEDQLFKIPTKWEFDPDMDISTNMIHLINRNIYEYVAKKSGLLKKGYKFDNGNMNSNGEFIINLISPENCTEDVVNDITFGDNLFHIIYKIPVNE